MLLREYHTALEPQSLLVTAVKNPADQDSVATISASSFKALQRC